MERQPQSSEDIYERLGDIWALRVLLTEPLDIEREKFRIAELYELAAVEEGNAPQNNTGWRGCIASRLEALEAQPVPRETALFANIAMLVDLLGLTPAECEILSFLVLTRTHLALQSVVHCLSRGFSESRLARLFSVVLKLDAAQAREAIGCGGTLASSGLICIQPGITSFTDKIGIIVGLVSTLFNDNGNMDELIGFCIEKAPDTCLSRADYRHAAEDISLLLDYLPAARRQGRKGVNVLFYGKPGTGKTELARLIARELNMTLYSVKNTEPSDDTPLSARDRCSVYLLVQKLYRRRHDALVLFDEIEDVVTATSGRPTNEPDASAHKAWTNRLLEENPVPCIWISNRVSHIDTAFLRRFDYVVELRSPPRRTRLKLLEHRLGKHAGKEQIIRNLADEEELTPAVIERAGKVLECLPDRNAQTLCRIVSNQLRAQGHAPRPRYPEPADYRLEFVNTDADIGWLETALADRPCGRILLHGAPGTGKTAYAHHLADMLGRPLQFRRASDLLSMWVGGTESNIAEMFRKAGEDGAMVLLDEADSLLQSREYAHHNWEVTQVNELLTQMEAFGGIFVCATNFLKHLDRAALRRFSLKIGFGYLTTEQSLRLLNATINRTDDREPDEGTLAPVRERLSRIGNLTPGDFTVVRQQAEMLGRAMSLDEFLDSLERECALKLDGARRPIGFVA